jgi:hypothetical protein
MYELHLFTDYIDAEKTYESGEHQEWFGDFETIRSALKNSEFADKAKSVVNNPNTGVVDGVYYITINKYGYVNASRVLNTGFSGKFIKHVKDGSVSVNKSSLTEESKKAFRDKGIKIR